MYIKDIEKSFEQDFNIAFIRICKKLKINVKLSKVYIKETYNYNDFEDDDYYTIEHYFLLGFKDLVERIEKTKKKYRCTSIIVPLLFNSLKSTDRYDGLIYSAGILDKTKLISTIGLYGTSISIEIECNKLSERYDDQFPANSYFSTLDSIGRIILFNLKLYDFDNSYNKYKHLIKND